MLRYQVKVGTTVYLKGTTKSGVVTKITKEKFGTVTAFWVIWAGHKKVKRHTIKDFTKFPKGHKMDWKIPPATQFGTRNY